MGLEALLVCLLRLCSMRNAAYSELEPSSRGSVLGRFQIKLQYQCCITVLITKHWHLEEATSGIYRCFEPWPCCSSRVMGVSNSIICVPLRHHVGRLDEHIFLVLSELLLYLAEQSVYALINPCSSLLEPPTLLAWCSIGRLAVPMSLFFCWPVRLAGYGIFTASRAMTMMSMAMVGMLQIPVAARWLWLLLGMGLL